MAKPKKGDICVFYNEEFKLPYLIGVLKLYKNQFYYYEGSSVPFKYCILLSELDTKSLNNDTVVLDPLKELSNDEFRYLQKLDDHLMKKHSVASLNGDLKKLIMYQLGGIVFYQNQATMMNLRMFLDKSGTKPSDWKIHTRTI